MRTARCVFIIMGSIIGAGFISGRELLRFFGGEGFIPTAFIASSVFFLLIYFLLSLGRRHGGFKGVKRAFPRPAAIAFDVLLYVSLFIITSGMLAGIDSLFPAIAPLPAALSAAVCALLCVKGMNGLAAANMFAVPCILIFLAVAITGGGDIGYSSALPDPMRTYSAVVYAGLNIFLAAPVICDLGEKMEKGKAAAALITAALLFVFMCLILLAVGGKKEGESYSFPLLYALKKYPFFKSICLFGAFTTLISAYYPLFLLCSPLKRPAGVIARAAILLAAGALSRIGFGGIVEGLYPPMAAAGFAMLLSAALYYFLFYKRNGGVHSPRHSAKKRHRRHDKIELEHLPAVDD